MTKTQREKLCDLLDGFFKISERGSTIFTEVRAGLSSFLTLSYILLVHPQVMAKTGMEVGDVVTATCLSAGVATLFVALAGNLPFVMVPGLGLSAYFNGLVLTKGSALTWQQALGCVLIAGLVMFLLSVTFLVDRCMKYVPDFLKTSTIAGIGLLLAVFGFEMSGFIVQGELADVFASENWTLWLFLAGLLTTAILKQNNVLGAIAIGVVSTALVYWIASNDWPDKVGELPSLGTTFSELRLTGIPASQGFSAVVTFLLVMLFDCTGCLVAFAMQAKLIDDISQPVPGGTVTLVACSLGTCLAALTGCSPLIIAVESMSGILDGGRTGLTAVVTALLLFLSLFFAPLFGAIPELASGGVLVLIGSFMVQGVKDIEWHKMEVAVPAFILIILMPVSHSISNGIWFGSGAALVFAITGASVWRKLGASMGISSCQGPEGSGDEAQSNDDETSRGGQEDVKAGNFAADLVRSTRDTDRPLQFITTDRNLPSSTHSPSSPASSPISQMAAERPPVVGMQFQSPWSVTPAPIQHVAMPGPVLYPHPGNGMSTMVAPASAPTGAVYHGRA